MLKNIANSQIAFIFAFWTNAMWSQKSLKNVHLKQQWTNKTSRSKLGLSSVFRSGQSLLYKPKQLSKLSAIVFNNLLCNNLSKQTMQSWNAKLLFSFVWSCRFRTSRRLFYQYFEGDIVFRGITLVLCLCRDQHTFLFIH